MITYKLKSRTLSERKIEQTVFIGIDGQPLEKVGKLILSVGEWQMFGALLRLGAEEVNNNYFRVEILTEGDDDVIKAFREED